MLTKIINILRKKRLYVALSIVGCASECMSNPFYKEIVPYGSKDTSVTPYENKGRQIVANEDVKRHIMRININYLAMKSKTDPEAAEILADVVEQGICCDRDLQKAADFRQYAADNGMPQAAIAYAIMRRYGNGVAQDVPEAIRYLEMAVGKLRGEAEYELGCIYWSGAHKDWKKAAHYFKLSADLGNIDGISCYGGCLLRGEGVSRNAKEGLKYLELAAQNGDAKAGILAGSVYERGVHARVDYVKAADLYHQAAETEDAEAQYHYGRCLALGIGREQDLVQAAVYYALSSDQGFPAGMGALGFCLASGKGVPEDKVRGAELCKKAADAGDERAQYNYAAFLMNGIGVEKNVNLAEEYLNKSIENGYKVPKSTQDSWLGKLKMWPWSR
jgi:TPR repeat protein